MNCRGAWRRCATSMSWTRSARRIAPRPARTASRSTRRSFAPGRLLVSELSALETALEKPARPLLAIVAGSKVSTKLTVLESLLSKVDQLIVGGGITNTFLAALGFNVGKSLYEPNMLDICRRLLEQSKKRGIVIPMPTDVVVAKEFSAKAEADVKDVRQVSAEDMILDIGPDSAEAIAALVASAGTILWNGPVGVFEFAQFGEGTRTLATAIARSKAFSLAGGRRHPGRHREIRHRGQHFLHIHRRRRFSGIRRRQKTSRGRDSRAARGMSSGLRRTKIVATLGPATDDPAVLDGHGARRRGCGAPEFLAWRGCRSCAPRRTGARGGAPDRPLRGRARRSAGPEDPHRPLCGRQGRAGRRRRIHA